MARICLNSIIKNEILNLPRMLESVVGQVSSVCIYDTGSTDGSQEFIKAFCKQHKLPCRVVKGTFENFEQARNAALDHARLWHVKSDYLLLMDADMELKVAGPLPVLTADVYSLVQRQGGMTYHNARLMRTDALIKYHGVTHEYLDGNHVALPDTTWWFEDHATGSNRPEKFERDKRLLEDYLFQHPGDGRSLFYLAQTYRDGGEHSQAIDLYRQRIAVGGWDEEVWYSQLQIARSYRAIGNTPAFLENALLAYNMRPSRAEPLYDLARHYRDKDNQQQTGWLFADAGAKIKYPGDMLFVEQWVYDWGFTEEKSILGAYNDVTREAGAAACNKLTLSRGIPAGTREQARTNMFYYLRPLASHAPSFKAVRLPEVNPDKTFVNTNPSVIGGDKVQAVIRTVSYRIRPDGTYDYNGLPSIRTTNFLVELDHLFDVVKSVEIQRPTGFPEPVSTEVRDVEDLRLINVGGELWANGCVLEQNKDFWREQFLMKINPNTGEATDWRKIEPNWLPKQHEKNWMPFVNNSGFLWFMYKPGVVMDKCGSIVQNVTNALDIDHMSGGGQLIPFDSGWLAIVHEARPDPTNGKRYYQHRFMWVDDTYAVQKVSRPFVFFDKQIEFAAGLAWNPYMGIDGSLKSVLISFGVRDCEAWVGTVSDQDVRDLLWHS